MTGATATAATGWCGWCGVVFDLPAVLDAAAPRGVGHCPRCARPFAPAYASTLVGLLRAVVAGTARRQDLDALADVAPHLHLLPDPGTAP